MFRAFLLITALIGSFTVSAKEWLIDVRTAAEYTIEHAEGAINIEYQQIVIGAQQAGIPKQDTVHLYCRSGRRAEIAKELLMQNGYQKVDNLGSLQDAESWAKRSRLAMATNR
ncbi:rhodanese-like domain-containing protein [uncultured Tolumonas sp.]|uniref:rhodanese-like domain-containing protein n=1 Tax=uncultured Tolumonas sp. TaxID=263765 RepID=UPI002A0A9EA3|nr:rhodanese-like domain-containing protein [uncultured Tolumonas sp.]